jgi:hypothetical protein
MKSLIIIGLFIVLVTSLFSQPNDSIRIMNNYKLKNGDEFRGYKIKQDDKSLVSNCYNKKYL